MLTRLFPSKNYYAVPVPVDARDCKIFQECTLTYSYGKAVHHSRKLPPGNYTILFASASATAQEASKVVDEIYTRYNRGFKNYDKFGRVFYFSPIQSLASLLRSLGLTEENYLIIEKTEG